MTAIVMNNSYGCGERSSTADEARYNRNLPALVRLPETLLTLLLRWQARAAERHRLGQLDDRMLSDMGISRADADAEAAKPFWRA